MMSLNSNFRAWLITDGLPGNETQIRGLESALKQSGVDVELKALRANRWHILGAALLGSSGLSINRARSDVLKEPWPDFVIGSGRRSGPWVRFVKRASEGKTKAVMFGQKGANFMSGLDLGFVLSHWNFPFHKNRKMILLPPTGVTKERLETASTQMPGLLNPAVGPWLLLVVGGRCFDHSFGPEDATKIALQAVKQAERLGGSLAIISSRRSGVAVEQALITAAPEAIFFPASTQPSPLYALFAQADAAIITGDSESMIAEAIMADIPTYITSVSPRGSLRMTIERTAAKVHRLGGAFAWGIEKFWEAGMIMPPRNLDQMTENLVKAKFAHRFTGTIDLEAKPKTPSFDFVKGLVD